MEVINENWLHHFLGELNNSDNVNIVSPFITDNIVKHLLDNFKGETIKVITRYNLNDFRRGVSSLTAIDRLVKNNALVKGVSGLHSKVYLFDKKSVIITSANFTNGGFFNNKEFGILSAEPKTVKDSYYYFNELWNIDSELLNQSKVNEWKDIISNSKPIPKLGEELPDFGCSYQKSIIGEKQYFIKFFGKDDNRLSLNVNVAQELRWGCSHFALSFSKNKKDRRPRRYKNGDVVYMARMTDTKDYAIFGRAITYEHDDLRDVASKEDIRHINWLADWSILIRVKEPVFINSSFKNCPKLNDLLNELDYASFASTNQRFIKGERDINTKNALMQKGDVILSASGAQYMELAFQKAIQKEGAVDDLFINSLYQSLKIND